jgi:PAS domain S-box-containing protein
MLANGSRARAPGQLQVRPTAEVVLSMSKPSSEKRADRADPQDSLRQEAKPDLSESEAHFRTLVENAPEAIVVLDADLQVFVDANQNACDLFGLTLEQLKQHDPVSLSPALQPDGQPSSLAAWTHIEDALAGDTPTFEWMHRTAAGRDVRCEVRLVRLPSSQRRLVRGSIIDVTEQRRRDEQAQEGLKMDALGRLAAGIAHDFNNLLSVMNGSATLIEESEEATSSIRDEAKAILDAARRGSSLVSQLLTFAKCDDAPARELDLNEVIRDVATFAARLLDGRITIVLQLDGVTAPVCMNRSQFEQIVINLILNARDAIQGRLGAITISTRFQESTVNVRVADTGAGMTEATRQRVFEPFFTTKAGSGGTGLGLATVYSIVTKAGGSIEVVSAVGTGTAFDITLPRGEGTQA